MGKKLGLDKSYSALKAVTGSYPITGGTPTSTFMKRGLALTTSVNKGSKLLNIGKKVFSKTPIGRAVNLAVNVGSGIGIGYSYAKNKFNKKDVDKKMGGGMMQGYGAARTSGMGLEDQSLMPGKMTKAALGILAMKKAKDKGAKGPELLSSIAMAKRFFNKGGKMTKAKYGKHMKK